MSALSDAAMYSTLDINSQKLVFWPCNHPFQRALKALTLAMLVRPASRALALAAENADAARAPPTVTTTTRRFAGGDD